MAGFLLFQLYGPMAAWGDIAVGERRPAQAQPSKSAIIGLLAAALGVTREQEEKQRSLAQGIGCAVLVKSRGIPLTDYHTIQMPRATHCNKKTIASRRQELAVVTRSELSTLLSYRDYRCDALAHVVVWLQPGFSDYGLPTLAEALNRPRFVLYLGRKSAPLALPVQAHVVTADTVLAALDTSQFSPWQGLEELLSSRHSQQEELYWDAEASVAMMGIAHQKTFTCRDMLLSKKQWQFSVRQTKYTTVPKER